METDSLYGAARSDNDDELFLDNFDDDLDDEYSGESDVFEDDFEALEYYELARERALGIDDCMVEMKSTTQPQDTAFPYPRYLAKLPELISENSVFGKDVVQYLYCNNLTVLSCYSYGFRDCMGNGMLMANGCLCVLFISIILISSRYWRREI